MSMINQLQLLIKAVEYKYQIYITTFWALKIFILESSTKCWTFSNRNPQGELLPLRKMFSILLIYITTTIVWPISKNSQASFSFDKLSRARCSSSSAIARALSFSSICLARRRFCSSMSARCCSWSWYISSSFNCRNSSAFSCSAFNFSNSRLKQIKFDFLFYFWNTRANFPLKKIIDLQIADTIHHLNACF